MSRPLIYLITTAGIPNYGDELIAMAWLRHLARERPDADVLVDTVRPSAAAETLAGIHPSVRFTSTLWPVALLSPSWEAADISRFAASIVADPARLAEVEERFKLLIRPDGIPWEASPDSVLAGLEDLVSAEVVHMVGGGYLNGIWPVSLGVTAGVGAALQRGAGRAVMTGEGIGPYDAGATDVIRGLIEPFTLVDVRDTVSAEVAGLAAAQVTCDDVFLDLGPELYATHGKYDVVVNAQADHGASVEGLTEFVVSALSRWKVEPGRVAFVECRPGADDAVYKAVAQSLPEVAFVPVSEVLADGLPAGPGVRWISTRFHPHLVAAAAGSPGVAISVQPEYYDAKHSSLIALGSGWPMLTTLSDPVGWPEGEGFDQAKLKALREQKVAVAERVYGTRRASA
ncbi:polysaccharide pyruvyl transferase WcaK-like protein [Catenulispora sp. MAP5-51]|uniref:polysaccharide pyruvyl transferase family protein n=1 Tax=Catenulispora sp. MAP5-51 TaxID=3156298 RepID=UPI003517EBC7